MTGETDDRDEISEETRRMVARIRERAAASPGSAEIADLLTAAAARGSQMSAAEISALSRDTLVLAGQVSFLLGKLAGLLEEGGLDHQPEQEASDGAAEGEHGCVRNTFACDLPASRLRARQSRQPVRGS